MAQQPKRRPEPGPGDTAQADVDLLARAHAGDSSAFLELFLHNLPSLERYVRREIRYLEVIGTVETGLVDAHAVVDQVYIASKENLKRMPEKASFRGWLRYLALRIMNQHAREERLEEPAGLTLERMAPASGDVDTSIWEYYQPDDVVHFEDLVSDDSARTPEEWVEWREVADEIQDRLNALPPEQREAFVLRVIEGLSVDEIAEMKKKPPTVVRQAVHDAREALRKDGLP